MGEDRDGSKEEEQGRMSVDAPSLSDNRLYRSLAARQRRRLLFVLLDESEANVEEISRLLTGWGVTEGGTMASPGDYEKIRAELVHNHLPLLDDAGFVEYDRERGTVRMEALSPTVNTLIRQSVTSEPPTRS